MREHRLIIVVAVLVVAVIAVLAYVLATLLGAGPDDLRNRHNSEQVVTSAGVKPGTVVGPPQWDPIRR